MRKSISFLSAMALVVFFAFPAFSIPITNTFETRTLGSQNDFGIGLNPDMSFDRMLLGNFDPMSPQYIIGDDFTDTWIHSATDDNGEGHSDHGKFTFDLNGFTHQNITSAFIEIGYGGFETAEITPRLGILRWDGAGGYTNSYLAHLDPHEDGDFIAEMFWIDADLFGDLLTGDTMTLSFNFLRYYGDCGDGVVDYIKVGAWGNDGSGSAPVPEPSTVLLFGTGILGFAGFVRKKKTSLKS